MVKASRYQTRFTARLEMWIQVLSSARFRPQARPQVSQMCPLLTLLLTRLGCRFWFNLFGNFKKSFAF